MYPPERRLKTSRRSKIMADIFTKKQRSQIMSAVKNKDSKIEVEFRKKLWRAGIRYRKNPKGYFGKPDLAIKKRKMVIFVDSCFWHGCKRHCRMPIARKNYWPPKIERNKDRDKEVNRHYNKLGWTLLRFWEHEINQDIGKVPNKAIRKLNKLK